MCEDAPLQGSLCGSASLEPPTLLPPSTALDPCMFQQGIPCWSVWKDAPLQASAFFFAQLDHAAVLPPPNILLHHMQVRNLYTACLGRIFEFLTLWSICPKL